MTVTRSGGEPGTMYGIAMIAMSHAINDETKKKQDRPKVPATSDLLVPLLRLSMVDMVDIPYYLT